MKTGAEEKGLNSTSLLHLKTGSGREQGQMQAKWGEVVYPGSRAPAQTQLTEVAHLRAPAHQALLSSLRLNQPPN